jgi:hypothetical protein
MAPPKAPEPEAAPLAELVEAWSLQLDTAPPLPIARLAQALQAAGWRAVGAVLAGDPAKAPAAAAAALEAAEAAAALLATPDDAPVREGEVVASLRRAVRRGLAADDPRKVGEALALWRAERALVDPEGVAGAGAAMDAALLAEVEAAADLARAAGLAMRAAGDCG